MSQPQPYSGLEARKLTEFRDREHFLIACYCEPSPSGGRWTGFVEGAVVVGSLGPMALWATTDERFCDPAGYAAVLTPVIASVARSRQLTELLRILRRKYDEKGRTLTDAAWMACQRGEGARRR